MERGRLCGVTGCFTKWTIAVFVRRGRRRFEAGLCRQHAVALTESKIKLPGRWKAEDGQRPLGRDENLDGPAS